MILVIRHPIIIWLTITLLIGQLGCATGPGYLPPPPSEQVRAQLGTIGMVSRRFIAEAELQRPPTGWAGGAGSGAGMGLMAGLEGMGGCGHLVCIFLPVVGAFLGVVIGSVAGGITGAPRATVEAAETSLKDALTDLRIDEALRDHVFRLGQEHTHRPFLLLTQQGHPALDQEVDYRPLATKGIDTILEISVLTLGLKGQWGINPPLAVFMRARTRLILTVDATVLYDSTLEYHGGTRRKFTEWAANNAQAFHEELDRAYESLAEKIVEEVFLVYYPPHERQQISQRDAPYKSSG